MGDYLSVPNKEKHVDDGGNSWLKYGATGMQGWRRTMEDSHIAALDVGGEDVAVFGVFDGHGGQEVALYVEKHFVEELEKSKSFKKGDY